MDSSESGKICAQYHLARARLLIDCLADSERVLERATLETTLRMITAELALTQQVLERPPRMASARCGARQLET